MNQRNFSPFNRRVWWRKEWLVSQRSFVLPTLPPMWLEYACAYSVPNTTYFAFEKRRESPAGLDATRVGIKKASTAALADRHQLEMPFSVEVWCLSFWRCLRFWRCLQTDQFDSGSNGEANLINDNPLKLSTCTAAFDGRKGVMFPN